MKIQKYVLEFKGTILDKDKNPFEQTFYVVAETFDAGLALLQKDNPKVTDFVNTGKFTPCGPDW